MGMMWYRQLKGRQRLVVQAIAFITSGQILMNILFVLYPRWTLTLLEWNMLTFSSVTSIAAVYYAVYTYWHSELLIETAVKTARKEIYDRLGVPFVKNLMEFGEKVDKRWSELSPEQRARILNKTDMIVDRVFNQLGEERPKPERKKVKVL